jgi:hypothetical protein
VQCGSHEGIDNPFHFKNFHDGNNHFDQGPYLTAAANACKKKAEEPQLFEKDATINN